MKVYVVILLLAALFAGGLWAHPFNDRADVIAEVYILDARRVRVRVKYLYEGPWAAFNEIRYFLDENKDGFVTPQERDRRLQFLVGDLRPGIALDVTLRQASGDAKAVVVRVPLVADPTRHECVDLVNPDNTVDQPGGMNARNVRLGYTVALLGTLPKTLEVGRYAAEFIILNKAIRIDRIHENMMVFDMRGKDRMVVSPLTHERNSQGQPRVRFTWTVGLAGDPFLTNTGDPSVPNPLAVAPPDDPQPATPAQPDESVSLRDDFERIRRERPSAEGRIDQMFQSLRDVRADFAAWALALLLAFGLGAWHALQPGHGKTLVAGYLIGTQGKKSDAIFLGIVVTLAHTSGVLLLMGGAAVASWLWPETMRNPVGQIAEWIAVAVGTTIFLMGAGLVLKRSGKGADHAHDAFGRHLPGDDHSHDHGHDHDHSLSGHHHHGRTHTHSHRHEDGLVHAHRHEHAAVAVASESDDDWLREHVGQLHEHSHEPKPVAAKTEEKLTRWQILRLGILGGVIPCPTAFVIGLVSFQQQWYLAGLVMIIVFSLGLACVLSAIGLSLVVTRGYLTAKLKSRQGPMARFVRTRLPVLGALIITLIGFAMVLLSLARLEIIDLASFSV